MDNEQRRNSSRSLSCDANKSLVEIEIGHDAMQIKRHTWLVIYLQYIRNMYVNIDTDLVPS